MRLSIAHMCLSRCDSLPASRAIETHSARGWTPPYRLSAGYPALSLWFASSDICRKSLQGNDESIFPTSYILLVHSYTVQHATLIP